ncbi:MAG: TlpA family protein disulfide reductase [Zoogloeaceae bacterium]|nr:TlpA family protein disulfide reductase [Zoogloeaceae bacterium]
MKENRVIWLVGATSVLTLVSIGYLGYRIYGMSQLPSQEELAAQARMARQVAPEAAQAGIDALLAMNFTDLAGQPQPFAQWKGKVLVLNYWASWCKPCVEEMPMLSRVAEQFAAKGVQFVGVGLDETEKMQAFTNKTPVSYPLLAAGASPNGALGLTVRGLPYTVVLGRDGKVAYSVYGGIKEADLTPVLEKLL